ncbi:hypothetical protein CR513_57580, partial [Mucuna pruriens]
MTLNLLIPSSKDSFNNKELYMKLLGKCVLVATYIINRTPTVANKGTTPYEMMFGKAPLYGHIKGWKVYNLKTREFLVSRDVVFYEDVFPYGTMEKSEGKNCSSPHEALKVGPRTNKPPSYLKDYYCNSTTKTPTCKSLDSLAYLGMKHQAYLVAIAHYEEPKSYIQAVERKE